MCGIVGYIGSKDVTKELVESLKYLEYRGYDSAGLGILNDSGIHITKSEGNISCLENKIKQSSQSYLGIAHTRWATHGKPTTSNAHPHISPNGEWALVHNGIIENYGELKRYLNVANYSSQTDTEVIVHLLQKFNYGNYMGTIIKVCQMLKGSYALAVMNKSKKDTLYLAKQKSPLYVANNKTEVFVASDPICFAGKAESYFALEDHEFCEAKIEGIVFYNTKGHIIQKSPISLSEFEMSVGKKNYSHFMLKEIEEVPQVLKRIVKTYNDNEVFEKLDNNWLNQINKVVLIGCGTAYHAGLMGARFIEQFARIESHCYVASEFRYSNPIIDDKTLVLLVSQSGETADTIMAHDLSKKLGAKTIALTNVLYSTLAKKSDYILPVCAGPEIAVASTKAYTAQIAVLNMFAKFLSNLRKNTNFVFIKDITMLAENIRLSSKKDIEQLAIELSKENMAFFIGRGLDYITSEEASLKLKEITYINSQAYPAGELKHGLLALVEEGTYVFVIATQEDLLEKTLNGAHEAAARGAKLVLATQFTIPKENLVDVHHIINLQNFEEDLMPIASIGIFQMLSFLTSVTKGINPDQPRNLAKSVTVE